MATCTNTCLDGTRSTVSALSAKSPAPDRKVHRPLNHFVPRLRGRKWRARRFRGVEGVDSRVVHPCHRPRLRRDSAGAGGTAPVRSAVDLRHADQSVRARRQLPPRALPCAAVPDPALPRGEGVWGAESVNWGSGSPRREFLHVDDLARACLHLLEHYDADGPVNVGAGTDLTIRELAELVADVVGYRGAIEWDTGQPDGTPRKLLDVSRLTALGWAPRIDLREGLAQTYAWYVENLGSGTLRR